MKQFNILSRTSLLAIATTLSFAAGSFSAGFSSESLAQTNAINAYNSWYSQTSSQTPERPAPAGAIGRSLCSSVAPKPDHLSP